MNACSVCVIPLNTTTFKLKHDVIECHKYVHYIRTYENNNNEIYIFLRKKNIYNICNADSKNINKQHDATIIYIYIYIYIYKLCDLFVAMNTQPNALQLPVNGVLRSDIFVQ